MPTKTTAPAHHFIARDFSAKVRRALSNRGITIRGATTIPGSGDMPFANGMRGYCLDNNGQHQVRTFAQVEEMACA